MPKIQSYDSPQLGMDLPNVKANGDLRYSQDVNQAIGNAGQALGNISDMIYKRNVQNELSDLNAAFSEARVDWTNRLDDDTRKGNVDTEKIQEDYKNYIDNLGVDVQTRDGKEFMKRQSARLGASVLKTASRAQAIVAGAKAEASWRTALDNNGSSLMSDPSSFNDVYASTIDTIDAQVSAGVMPAAHAEKFKRETGAELAKSSMRGWARLDPDLAQKKLDEGEFDSYLSGDAKSQMQGYINQQKSANEIEDRRAIAAQEKAKKLASEGWQQTALPSLSKGALPTKAILDSPMDANEKIRWLKLADEAAKQQTEGDPRVFNNLIRRATLPDGDPAKITSISQMANFAGRGVSIQQIEQINGFIQKLPEGKNANDNRERLMSFATSKLIKKDAFTGVSDPDGEFNMSQFTFALQEAEKKQRDDKKPVADLYNPNSPDYFGKQISKYQLTPQAIFAKMAGRMKDETTKQQDALPQQDQAPQENQSKTRRRGEKMTDFLKRTKEPSGG